jgi:hypothetical protein
MCCALARPQKDLRTCLTSPKIYISPRGSAYKRQGGCPKGNRTSKSQRIGGPESHLINRGGLFPESLRVQVAGVTGDAFVGRWPRNSEILIDVSKRSGRWRALDDSCIEFPKDCPELIRCNPSSLVSQKSAPWSNLRRRQQLG